MSVRRGGRGEDVCEEGRGEERMGVRRGGRGGRGEDVCEEGRERRGWV